MKLDSFIVIAQRLLYIKICRHVLKGEYCLRMRSHFQKQKSDLEIWQVSNKVLFFSCKFHILFHEICGSVHSPTIISETFFKFYNQLIL